MLILIDLSTHGSSFHNMAFRNVRQFHNVAQPRNTDYKLESAKGSVDGVIWCRSSAACNGSNGIQMVQGWGKELLILALYGGVATAQPGRGELLYSTYCSACHTEQVHWREKKVVTDWPSLVAEVRRWQENTKLEWSEDDVEAVAQHLNDLYYHYR